MAVTNQNSTEYANLIAVPLVRNETTDWNGRLRFQRFTFTQSGAGDATSTVTLTKLPAGRVRVFNRLTSITTSAFGSARTLDYGWAAYNSGVDGSTVNADADGLDAARDVSAAISYNPTGTVGGDETYLFNSASGVVLNMTVAGGTIPNGATINGYLVYTQD